MGVGLWPRKTHPDVRLLSCYLDRQVSERERQRVEAHLALCPSCREVLEDLRQVRQALQTLPWEEPSRPIRLAPAQPVRPRPATPQWVAPTAVAAALLLVVLVATDLSLGLQAGQRTPLPPPGAAAVQPGQGVLILTPDIPKETGAPPPLPSPTPTPAPSTPAAVRPLLAWLPVEGALAFITLLLVGVARFLRRRPA
jgi:hypothetical protein